jgi:hypothetical protein
MKDKAKIERRQVCERGVNDMVEGHERTLLAHFLVNEGSIRRYPSLKSEHFASPAHSEIFLAIQTLNDDGRSTCFPLVQDFLHVRGKLQSNSEKNLVSAIAADNRITAMDNACFDYALDCVLDAHREREVARIGKELYDGKITADFAREKLDEILKPVAADGLTVLTLDEILALLRDEHSCLVGDRLLAKGQSLVIAGQPGLGKSRLALQLAVACITGLDFCGIETRARGLGWLVLQSENGAERLRKDAAALIKWAGRFDQSKLLVQVIQSDRDGFLCLGDAASVAAIEATIGRVLPDVIVADPLRDFSIGDLNSDADMIATLRELSRIVWRGNPDRALVLLHHALTGRVGVAKAFGLERAGFARNSKALLGWTRAQINVIPGAEDSNDQLVLTCGKNSNGKEFPSIAVRLNSDTLIYELDTSFDMEGWRQEVSAPGKAGVKPQIFRELLEKGRDYDRKQLVALVREEKGIGNTRAYELVAQAKERGILRFNKMIKSYALA